MKKIFLMLVCALALSVQVVNAQEEVVTNALIIQLLDEGFSDEEIIGFIEASSTREVKSDLQSMRELKKHKASPELIKYIQKLAKSDFGYDGVYWWNTSDGEKPMKLLRSRFLMTAAVSSGVSGRSTAYSSPAVSLRLFATGLPAISTRSSAMRRWAALRVR